MGISVKGLDYNTHPEKLYFFSEELWAIEIPCQLMIKRIPNYETALAILSAVCVTPDSKQ